MGKQKWSAFGPLKRAFKKINFLLSFNFRKWRLASILSINDRIGLHGAIEDVESDHQKYKPFEHLKGQVSLQLRYYRGNSFGRDY
ncbi:hypothetical protein POTOM_024382 [Populus tomentosa]|uniref:Uncharacterized protein n=1 Tax=Populus tomentosa TaxID=118781 RepID=A0A8X7ZRV0_POPTO|nr:hypothetical protein POTOM_024382 [Populus tomentosa]